MKKYQKSFITPRDNNAATRKRRLQQRLEELSDKSEQELAALMRTVEKTKLILRPDKHRH